MTNNFLELFKDYTSFGESPDSFYNWVGIASVAAALERKVWLNMGYFKWYPNLYTVLVAPPGVATKSTTLGIAKNLLATTNVKFAPNITSWQALVATMEEIAEIVDIKGEFHTQSALTVEASELGNFLDCRAREMIDLLTELYDCREGVLTKTTKHVGRNVIENPCLNILGCTTPAWIADNFTNSIVNGGLASRCIFVYGAAKRQLVAYPSPDMLQNLKQKKALLVAQLKRISNLKGEMQLSKEAKEIGEQWYKVINTSAGSTLDCRFSGFLSRRQAHAHKLAMILSACRGDSLIISAEDLATSITILKELELHLPEVYNEKKHDNVRHLAQLLSYITANGGRVSYKMGYSHIMGNFPGFNEWENLLIGAIRSGKIKLDKYTEELYL